jgi:hypothetical protein
MTHASKEPTVKVSERNLQKAAQRVLPNHNKLVSSEISYLLRKLPGRATQEEIDEAVVASRRLPWSELIKE